MSDPYRLAGLERNPFVAEATPGVAGAHWIERGFPDPPQWRAGHLVQLIGEKGAGKTSHMLRWSEQTPGPYTHIEPGLGRLEWLPTGRVVYWDEADRALLIRVALRHQRRIGGMTIVGVHRSVEAAALAAGLTVETYELPPLTTDDVRRFAAARIVARGAQFASWAHLPFASIARESAGSLRRAGELLHVALAESVSGSERAAGTPSCSPISAGEPDRAADPGP